MKKNLKLGGVLILLVLFIISCQKKNLIDEIKVAQGETETHGTTLKTTEQFEFGISLFTQDEPEGPVVAATGTLIVESNGVELYNGPLVEGINRIVVSDEPIYSLKIEKEGYVTYQHEFTYAELEVHKIQRYTVPLEVILQKRNGIFFQAKIQEYNYIGVGFKGTENSKVYIDWGDGTGLKTLVLGSNEISLTHYSSSTVDVRITGDLDQISFLRIFRGGSQYSITGIDLSECTNLTTFDCSHLYIPSINVSKNLLLEYLSLWSNGLTNLDISNNGALRILQCHNGKLTNIDLSKNLALVSVDLSYNYLSQLDVSNNLSLSHLNCSGNQIGDLDVSSNSLLTNLDCTQNQLISLNLKIGNYANLYTVEAELNPSLRTICVDDVSYANSNFHWTKDATASYSTCN